MPCKVPDTPTLRTASKVSCLSYVFSGEVGYFDYAMASTSILAQVTGTTIWDINSDEPRVLSYNDDILDPGRSYINPGAYLYGPHSYRPLIMTRSSSVSCSFRRNWKAASPGRLPLILWYMAAPSLLT